MKYPTIEECRKRMEQLLAQPKFVKLAKDFLANGKTQRIANGLLSHRKTYNEQMQLCRDVLKTSYGQFRIDDNKLRIDCFHDKEIVELTLDFYKHLDNLVGDNNTLHSRAVDNLQYLNFFHNKQWRPNCGRSGANKWINVYIENTIRDAGNTAHEFGHSESDNFVSGVNIKDEAMREFCTVIIDRIFPEFLITKRPELKESLVNQFAEAQLISKAKARLSLFEGAFVQMMAGNLTLDNALNQYLKVYGDNPGPASDLLERIDRAIAPQAGRDEEFIPLYETRYLFPQMIGVYAREQYLKNPEDFAKKFKYVLQHDYELTEEEALKLMDFPEKAELIEWYKQNIAKIIQEEFDSLQKESEDDAENQP